MLQCNSIFEITRRVPLSQFVIAAVCLVVGWSPACGQIASAIIRQGDVVPGASTISGIDSPAVNGVDGYAFGTTNADTLSRFFGNPTGGPVSVLRTEGTIGPYTQTAFEAFFGISDSGSIGYSPTVSDGVLTGLDCAWMDSMKILNEQDPVPSLPGQFSVFNSDVQITHNGTPYWVGGFANAPGASTQNRALFSGLGATVLIQGGDMIPSAGAPLSMTAGPGFGSRLSALGSNWIIGATMSAPATSANDAAVVVNGDLLNVGGQFVREGTAIPVSVGGIGDNWANFDALAINEAGEAFFTGDTSAATTVDEFVFVRDSIVLREGAMVATPLGNGTIDGAIEWGDANEQNDWAVTWDVAVGGSNLEALIVNGNVALMETQLVDWNGDGMIDAGDNNGRLADFTGIRAVAVGDQQMGGSYFDVFFTADIDFFGTASTTDDLEGGFRYRVIVPEPANLALLAGVMVAVFLRRRPT